VNLTQEQAWKILEQIPDPELPAVSICELGIVREVRAGTDTLTVVVTPTYSGCPATEMIAGDIRSALVHAGATNVEVRTQLAPAWTSDWISAEARAKLRAHGIVPPQPGATTQPLHFVPRTLPCPRCGSTSTARLSEFGSTACKALYRCESCREPFEYFKKI
jgi:ring-1,2-phenylacetyl-CoA epoxidase subunit PaaD